MTSARIAQAVLLWLLALPVGADPATIAVVVTFVTTYATVIQLALTVALNVYASSSARRAARRAQSAARAAYNSSLQDRNVTALQAVPPLRIVYGRCITGGDIVAIFTSDATRSREDGTTYSKPDALKHVVIVMAAHQVQAIGEVFIAGIPLGTLDGSGYVTQGEFMSIAQTQVRYVTIAPAGNYLAPSAVTVQNAWDTTLSSSGSGADGVNMVAGSYTLTVGNTQINNTGANPIDVTFTFQQSTPRVKIDKFLGTDAQTVNAYLNSVVPTQWTTNHRLRGLAGIIVTLDLEETRFQGGPPPITAEIQGKLIFDTRSSTTAWSDNPALCIRDYLTSALGMNVPTAYVDTTFCNAAANACDVGVNIVDFSRVNNWFRFGTEGDLEGWSVANATLVVTGGSAVIDATGVPQFIRNNLSPTVAGTAHRAIRARIRRTAGSGWVGSALYDNTTHGFSASFIKTIAAPTFDPVTGWAEVLWDMTTLTTGGADWTTSTIRHIRLDLGATAADTFELDWVTIGPLTSPMYTMNGALTTGDGKEAALDLMAESMMGTVSYGASWLINAGAWTAPVMDLLDDDLDGQISFTQTDTPLEEVFNSVRGTFVPYLAQNPVEFDSYQNSTFVTDDGGALWHTLELPFCNNGARATNIARIKTEIERGGQVIQFPAKLKAWPLQVGDRVRVSSTEYGLSLKTYQVTDWQFSVNSAVVLTLQEDVASSYDLISATTSDPSPNTNLPNPWKVTAPSGVAAASGTTHLMRQADGTILTRVKVTWSATADAYIIDGLGKVRIRYRRQWIDGVGVWHLTEVPGDQLGVYLTGMADGEALSISVQFINSLGVESFETFISHTVVGKTQVPGNVSGLTSTIVQGGARIGWSDLTDVDYESTELRVGASWAAGTFLFRGNARNWTWLSPAQGTYTVRAKHWDTSGNESTTDQTVSVVIDAAALIIIGASQFTGTLGGANVVPNSSFEQDSNVDGLPDSWGNGGTNGTVGAVTRSIASGAGLNGSKTFRLAATNLGTTTGDQVYNYGDYFNVNGWAGRLATLSLYTKADVAGTGMRAYVEFVDAAFASTGSSGTLVVASLTTALTRYSLVGFTVPANTVWARGFVIMEKRPSSPGAAAVDFDAYQVELGDVLTAYAPRTDELLPSQFGGIALGGGNVIANASFDSDKNADGLADSWEAYSNATTGTITRTVPTSGGFNNGRTQRVSAAGLGTSTSDQAGVRQTLIRVDGWAGQPYVYSAYLKGDASGLPPVVLFINWVDSGGGVVGQHSQSFTITSTLARYSFSNVVPATAVRADVYLWMQSRPASAGLSAVEFDGVQLELGSVLGGFAPKVDEILQLNATTGQALNFDPNTSDEAEWQTGTHPIIATGIASGITGSTALHSATNGVDEHVYSPFARSIPVDRLKAYRVSALIRKGGAGPLGTANVYLGIMGWSSAGVDQRGVGSPSVPYTAYNVAVSALTTSFVRHTVTISQATIAAMQSGVVFIGPHCILGYTGASTLNGWIEMQDVRLEEVASTQTIDANAAAEVITVTATGPVNCIGTFGSAGTAVVTANLGPYPFACEVECTFVGYVSCKPDPHHLGPAAITATVYIDGSAGTDSAIITITDKDQATFGTATFNTPFAASHTFTLPANTSGSAIGRLLVVAGDTAPAPGPVGDAYNAIIRATAVKR